MSAVSIVVLCLCLIVVFLVVRYVLKDPNTLQGLQSGKTASTISASTLSTVNGTSNSTNFAYSVWFYVNDWNYRYGEPKVIVGRMGATTSTSAAALLETGADPCPSIMLGAVENNVNVSVGCFPGIEGEAGTGSDGTRSTVVHTCTIANVPLQKWVNIVVSVNGRTMDLSLDGKLVRTCLLPGVVNVNNSADIHVTPAGGFDGWTSKIQYFPNPLNSQQTQNIYNRGYSKGLFNFFGNYQVKLDVVENGNTQSSITL
jgi:hypothetical protein